MAYYAWTCSSVNLTFWTNTENPTASSHIFDNNGNDVTSTYIGPERGFYNVSSASITFRASSKGCALPISETDATKGTDYVYLRDSSKDIGVEPTTIAGAITAAQGKVANAYTAVLNKGGTLPATQNLSNLPTAINSISTGGTISSLTITPTTSQQTITASGGTDGYSPITVNAVTSSIDNNITAGNIKSGVSILGVNGSLTQLNGTSLSVIPTTSSQSLTPSSPYNGYTSVSVSAVTSSIDANITAGNIKKDVQILGVTGTYEGSGGGGGLIMTDNFYFDHDKNFNLASVTATVGYAISGDNVIALLYDSNGNIIYESPTGKYLCISFEVVGEVDEDEASILIFDIDEYPHRYSKLHIPLS